jgi:Fe-S-cluster containining protein
VTECSRCGDCCEDIWFANNKRRLREIIAEGDPRDDAVWESWLDVWETEGTSRENQDPKRPGFVDVYESAAFIVKHWHGGVRAKGGATNHWTCDAFDPETRLCTAHDERPHTCRGFPWYGKDPTFEVAKRALPTRCSFWADVPTPVPVAIRAHPTAAA